MSDTTTITPEERAEWRNRLTLLKREVENKGFRHGCAEMALRLLNVLEQAEARAEKAEAENARLRAELETAKQVAASAQAVAQEAWAGEIPSPLPGHKRANEEELLAQVEHLNCPLCGGSGHIGDCEGD